ncbi:MAG: extracellular solute-binding protein [bacterium]|nr:extracellular solute-binding protein [bacterium]
MKEAKGFQLAILGTFGAFIFLGVLAFAGILPGFSNKATKDNLFLGNVTIWGTLPQAQLMNIFEDFNNENKKIVTVTYFEKSKGTFERELIEALADGIGPDMILLSQDYIVRHRNKIYPIPYEVYPERDLKTNFIEEGELYLGDTGIYAVPFVVDPLVMYWNRDMFSSALISTPPSYWDEFFGLAKILTKIDNSSNIKKSLVSFGEYDNVANAKEILSMLMMQAGSSIVSQEGGVYRSTLSSNESNGVSPGEEAFRFYTEFSNPTKTSYSWNRSLLYSRDMFTTGDLALYFGFASEYGSLQKKNPHLNFDVTTVPQTRTADRKLTFGKMQGLSILKSSKILSADLAALQILSNKDVVASASTALNLPPVRRELLSQRPKESYLSVFYDGALLSKGWLDPSPSDTNAIFNEIVQDITSGRRKLSNAVENGNALLEKLLRKL